MPFERWFTALCEMPFEQRFTALLDSSVATYALIMRCKSTKKNSFSQHFRFFLLNSPKNTHFGQFIPSFYPPKRYIASIMHCAFLIMNYALCLLHYELRILHCAFCILHYFNICIATVCTLTVVCN